MEWQGISGRYASFEGAPQAPVTSTAPFTTHMDVHGSKRDQETRGDLQGILVMPAAPKPMLAPFEAVTVSRGRRGDGNSHTGSLSYNPFPSHAGALPVLVPQAPQAVPKGRRSDAEGIMEYSPAFLEPAREDVGRLGLTYVQRGRRGDGEGVEIVRKQEPVWTMYRRFDGFVDEEDLKPVVVHKPAMEERWYIPKSLTIEGFQTGCGTFELPAYLRPDAPPGGAAPFTLSNVKLFVRIGFQNDCLATTRVPFSEAQLAGTAAAPTLSSVSYYPQSSGAFQTKDITIENGCNPDVDMGSYIVSCTLPSTRLTMPLNPPVLIDYDPGDGLPFLRLGTDSTPIPKHHGHSINFDTVLGAGTTAVTCFMVFKFRHRTYGARIFEFTETDTSKAIICQLPTDPTNPDRIMYGLYGYGGIGQTTTTLTGISDITNTWYAIGVSIRGSDYSLYLSRLDKGIISGTATDISGSVSSIGATFSANPKIWLGRSSWTQFDPRTSIDFRELSVLNTYLSKDQLKTVVDAMCDNYISASYNDEYNGYKQRYKETSEYVCYATNGRTAASGCISLSYTDRGNSIVTNAELSYSSRPLTTADIQTAIDRFKAAIPFMRNKALMRRKAIIQGQLPLTGDLYRWSVLSTLSSTTIGTTATIGLGLPGRNSVADKSYVDNTFNYESEANKTLAYNVVPPLTEATRVIQISSSTSETFAVTTDDTTAGAASNVYNTFDYDSATSYSLPRNNTITITLPTDYPIESIKITYSESGNFEVKGQSLSNAAVYNPLATITASNTVTGVSAQAKFNYKVITIKNTSVSARSITAIELIVADSPSNPANTFINKYYNAFTYMYTDDYLLGTTTSTNTIRKKLFDQINTYAGIVNPNAVLYATDSTELRLADLTTAGSEANKTGKWYQTQLVTTTDINLLLEIWNAYRDTTTLTSNINSSIQDKIKEYNDLYDAYKTFTEGKPLTTPDISSNLTALPTAAITRTAAAETVTNANRDTLRDKYLKVNSPATVSMYDALVNLVKNEMYRYIEAYKTKYSSFEASLESVNNRFTYTYTGAGNTYDTDRSATQSGATPTAVNLKNTVTSYDDRSYDLSIGYSKITTLRYINWFYDRMWNNTDTNKDYKTLVSSAGSTSVTYALSPSGSESKTIAAIASEVTGDLTNISTTMEDNPSIDQAKVYETTLSNLRAKYAAAITSLFPTLRTNISTYLGTYETLWDAYTNFRNTYTMYTFTTFTDSKEPASNKKSDIPTGSFTFSDANFGSLIDTIDTIAGNYIGTGKRIETLTNAVRTDVGNAGTTDKVHNVQDSRISSSKITVTKPGIPAVLAASASMDNMTTKLIEYGKVTAELVVKNYQYLYGTNTGLFTGTTAIPGVSPALTYDGANTGASGRLSNISGVTVDTSATSVSALASAGTLGAAFAAYTAANTQLFNAVRGALQTRVQNYSSVYSDYVSFQGKTSDSIDGDSGRPAVIPGTLPNSTTASVLADTIGGYTYSDANVGNIDANRVAYGADSYKHTSPADTVTANLPKLLKHVYDEVAWYIQKYKDEEAKAKYTGTGKPAIPGPTDGTINSPTTDSADLIRVMSAYGPLSSQLLVAGGQSELGNLLSDYKVLYETIQCDFGDAEKNTVITGITGTPALATFYSSTAQTPNISGIAEADLSSKSTEYKTALAKLVSTMSTFVGGKQTEYSNAWNAYATFCSSTAFQNYTAPALEPSGSKDTTTASFAVDASTGRFSSVTGVTAAVTVYIASGGAAATLATLIANQLNLVKSWYSTYTSTTYVGTLPIQDLDAPGTTLAAMTTDMQTYANRIVEFTAQNYKAFYTNTEAFLTGAQKATQPTGSTSSYSALADSNALSHETIAAAAAEYNKYVTAIVGLYEMVWTALTPVIRDFGALTTAFTAFQTAASREIDSDGIAPSPSGIGNPSVTDAATLSGMSTMPSLVNVKTLHDLCRKYGVDRGTDASTTDYAINKMPKLLTAVRVELLDYITDYGTKTGTTPDTSKVQATATSSAQELIGLFGTYTSGTKGVLAAAKMAAFFGMYLLFEELFPKKPDGSWNDVFKLISQLALNAAKDAGSRTTFLSGKTDAELDQIVEDFDYPVGA